MFIDAIDSISFLLCGTARQYFQKLHTGKSFRIVIKSTRNQIVFTIIRLIWNQTDVRLFQNQSENGKYNLISGWFNKVQEWFLCVGLTGKYFLFLVNLAQIRIVFTIFRSWFRTKRHSVWFQINRIMVNIIRMLVDMISVEGRLLGNLWRFQFETLESMPSINGSMNHIANRTEIHSRRVS